jgi:aminoglycoside 6'-N-acetyltransferase
MPSDATFEPLSLRHRLLLDEWTRQPHVLKWWSEAADDVDSFFEADDMNSPFIAYVGRDATAYIQCWKPSKNPYDPWQHEMTPTTRGIDLFIGPPDKIGQGLGSRIVRAFSHKLFAEGATRLVIDPDKRNERAIACYTKAGFRPFGEHEGDLLMELLPSSKPVIPAKAGT